MAKIYVASSWRNQHQPQVVSFLREQGHEVYDFRHPAGKTGFQWSQIDEDWENWSTDQYRAALEHPIAQAGFKSDFDAMQWADVCVLVLPCGRSAHSEQFTEYKEDYSLKKDLYSTLDALVKEYDFPICYDFPVGHVTENLPLINGAEVEFVSGKKGVELLINPPI